MPLSTATRCRCRLRGICKSSSTKASAALISSSKSGSFFVAAGTPFGGNEFALLHVEASPRNGLPFVETGLAQGDAVGLGLTAYSAGGLKVDDVGQNLSVVRPLFEIVWQHSLQPINLVDQSIRPLCDFLIAPTFCEFHGFSPPPTQPVDFLVTLARNPLARYM